LPAHRNHARSFTNSRIFTQEDLIVTAEEPHRSHPSAG
jgi:hypothetical protein